MPNKFQGFDLFNDIEDKVLRIRNRAVVLANAFQDNCKDGKVTPRGAAIILSYFKNIPEGERKDVQDKFTQDMLARGFRI